MAHKKIGILMAVCVLFGVCFVSCATTSEAHNKGMQHDGMMKDGDMSSDKNMKDCYRDFRNGEESLKPMYYLPFLTLLGTSKNLTEFLEVPYSLYYSIVLPYLAFFQGNLPL